MVNTMTNAQKLTLELIRYKIAGTPLSHEFSQGISDDDLRLVYEISTSQGVVGIVAEALSDLDMLDGELKQEFFNSQLANIYVTEQIKFELENISKLFEEEKIPFIPLKGSVIRNYYPKPEMRESCDIDILIHKEDLDRACLALKTKLNYEQRTKSPHDVGMFSPSETELELHHTLYTADDKRKKILDRVWDYAVCCDGYEYKFKMTEEFFVLYHLIHMVKHIINGGCGIRPFLDLYIINTNLSYNKDELTCFTDEAEITIFSEEVFKTAKAWYGNDVSDETTELMSDYVFSAGVYGSFENQVVTSLVHNGTKFRNLMDRIFMPYDKLKVIYPVIKKHPILTPWFEAKRWCRIIFKDKAKHQLVIMKHNANITEEKQTKVTKLMENLGLNERK